MGAMPKKREKDVRNRNTLSCLICNIPSIGFDALQSHKTGKQHKQNVKQAAAAARNAQPSFATETKSEGRIGMKAEVKAEDATGAKRVKRDDENIKEEDVYREGMVSRELTLEQARGYGHEGAGVNIGGYKNERGRGEVSAAEFVGSKRKMEEEYGRNPDGRLDSRLYGRPGEWNSGGCSNHYASPQAGDEPGVCRGSELHQNNGAWGLPNGSAGEVSSHGERDEGNGHRDQYQPDEERPMIGVRNWDYRRWSASPDRQR